MEHADAGSIPAISTSKGLVSLGTRPFACYLAHSPLVPSYH